MKFTTIILLRTRFVLFPRNNLLANNRVNDLGLRSLDIWYITYPDPYLEWMLIVNPTQFVAPPHN